MPEFLSTIFAKIKNNAQNGNTKEILTAENPLVIISAIFLVSLQVGGIWGMETDSIRRQNYRQDHGLDMFQARPGT